MMERGLAPCFAVRGSINVSGHTGLACDSNCIYSEARSTAAPPPISGHACATLPR